MNTNRVIQITAPNEVYLRLSSDDGDKLESNSITNQKDMITRHLSTLSNVKIYNYCFP